MSFIKLTSYARPVAFVVLALVTIFGVYRFLTGDWAEVIGFWRSHLAIIPLLAAFSLLDVALEGIAWMWVYHRFRIRAFDADASLVYLSGRAGLLLPAQLGRLIRPYGMAKLERAAFDDCLKAEAMVFVLDGVSVIGLIAGLLAYKGYPAAAPLAAAGAIGALLFLGNRITRLLTHTRIQFPAAFWWAWPSMVIILINMAGWAAHGLALYVVVVGLPGDTTVWDALFFGPGSAVLGVSTGLPGGIGATEGILGASLRLRSVPVEHLALAVAAFRLITFWAWIPIGWLALGVLKRRKWLPVTLPVPAGLSEK